MNTHTPLPPAAYDFSDPLALLRACHERMLQHGERLLALADHIAANGVDAQTREAASGIYKYFSVAGKHHHQDEEQDLFPRLACVSLKLADRVYRLKQQHQSIDALWQQLVPLLTRPTEISDTAAFQALARQFATAYRDHIRQENEELLEIAQHIFSREELRQIGEKMAERRGIQLKPR
ncbi:MAG: hemerythrin domain-containing protein [Gammaproteobacteria bacterium]|nr:hemerythrin domain-containing protein [Gammaproteobacteria bacterium]